jgi:hypothetical protein
VFAIGGSRNSAPSRSNDTPRENFQWSSNRGDCSQSGVGHNTRGWGVDGTRSGRTDSRTSTGQRYQCPPVEGGATSGPKNGDDRCAPRPKGIQCYKCGLFGHTQRRCPRGQNRNPNGIGRTNATPSFYPK